MFQHKKYEIDQIAITVEIIPAIKAWTPELVNG